MSELIHDVVRLTVKNIKAQYGGTAPDGLHIRHTNTAPYVLNLDCTKCHRSVYQWVLSEADAEGVASKVGWLSVPSHACWPKPEAEQPKFVNVAPPEYTPGLIDLPGPPVSLEPAKPAPTAEAFAAVILEWAASYLTECAGYTPEAAEAQARRELGAYRTVVVREASEAERKLRTLLLNKQTTAIRDALAQIEAQR